MYQYNQNGQKIPVVERYNDERSRHQPRSGIVERFSMGSKKMKIVWIVLIVVAVLLLAFLGWKMYKKSGKSMSSSGGAPMGCGMDSGMDSGMKGGMGMGKRRYGFRFY